MSLNWDLGNIQNNKTLCWVPDSAGSVSMNPVTEALIYRSMTLGLPEITAKNEDEWLVRTRIYSRAFSHPLHKITKDGPVGYDFSIEDIHSHIGLKTNASRLTRLQFLKEVAQQMIRKAEADVSTLRSQWAARHLGARE